jgi:hypothetical protein
LEIQIQRIQFLGVQITSHIKSHFLLINVQNYLDFHEFNITSMYNIIDFIFFSININIKNFPQYQQKKLFINFLIIPFHR